MKKSYVAGVAVLLVTAILSITQYSHGQTIMRLEGKSATQQREIKSLQKEVERLTPPTTIYSETVTTVYRSPEEQATQDCASIHTSGEDALINEHAPLGYGFSGYCDGTRRFGWFYQGSDADIWTFIPPSHGEFNSFGEGRIQLKNAGDYAKYGIPSGHQHPAYADALKLNDLKPGMVVCPMEGNNAIMSSMEITGIGVVTQLKEPNAITGYPAIGVADVGNTKATEVYTEATQYGVAPNDAGMWSTLRLVAGPCPK